MSWQNTHNVPVILAAVALELAPLRRRLPLIETLSRRKPLKLELRQSPSGPVLLGLTGMGPQRATRAMEYLLNHYRPQSILSVGFAGALQGHLRIGDLIFAQACYRLIKETPMILEKVSWASGTEAFTAQIRQLKPQGLQTWHQGCLISASEIITHSETKRLLGTDGQTSTPAMGVEMETAALLQVLEKNGRTSIPFISLRVISDTRDEDLQIDFSRLQSLEGPGGQKERVRIFSSLAYFIRNPRAAFRLRRLVRNAHRAAESLAQQLYPLIENTHLRETLA